MADQAGDHQKENGGHTPNSLSLLDNGDQMNETGDTPKMLLSPANGCIPLEPRLYNRRWLMVILFATYSMTNAYQWIHLNIIGDKILVYYNASLPQSEYMKDVALDWLSMVYMLAYIPLIFPSTWLLDKKGLHLVGILGTLLNALGAWLKCAAIDPNRFGVLMCAQTVCAIAQVFILGIPARLAAVWFGPNEVSTATAIGVFGNQIGCALGFLIPPVIVSNIESNTPNPNITDHNLTGSNTSYIEIGDNDLDFIGSRLTVMLYGGAVITTLLFLLVLVFFKKSPPVPPSIAQMAAVDSASSDNYFRSLYRLVINKGFILLLITYGLNTGSYYAIGTLLNPIVLFYFPSENLNAGRIGLTLVIAGVFGSIISGFWLDKTKLYKLTTVIIYILSCAGMCAFTFTLMFSNIYIVFLCSGILGFFMTGYLPVGFEFAAELTFPEPEGTSSGLLNASAQVFGIILTLGVRALTRMPPNGMMAGNLTISAVLLLGAIGTILIRSDLRRQKAQQQKLDHFSNVVEIKIKQNRDSHDLSPTDYDITEPLQRV